MTNEVIVKVEDYERNKIYRLNRRLDSLNELLEMLGNTQIQIPNSDSLSEKINRDIIDCKKRIQKWWNIIANKYNLRGKMIVRCETGEITRKQ